MKSAFATTFVRASLIAFLITATALGQSYVPPQTSGPNAYYAPGSAQQSGYPWRGVGSDYGSLGLETTPKSLNLRFPLSTGVPRPTYGYRPEPIRTYVTPRSAQTPFQDVFGLPRSMQQPDAVGQPALGRTRLVEPYAPETSQSLAIRPNGGPVGPTSPLAVAPLAPAGPVSPQVPGTPATRGPTAGAGLAPQTLGLPRLPWEAPEQAEGTVSPQPGGMGAAERVELPRLGAAIPPAPAGLGSPLDRIMQGGPGAYSPRGATPSGSLLRPLPGAEESPAAPAGDEVRSDRMPAAASAARRPLLTSAGVTDSAATRYLQKGEAELQSSEYARAAGSFELARVVAPKDPAPLLGRALALLATGEFSSSANNLFLAVELLPAPAEFRRDIKNLLADQKLLDRRIRELQGELKRLDDFRLRFLLGYVEYCTGDETAGLIEMTQAVQKIPPERPAARRLLEALRKERLSHPPATTAPAAAR